MSLDERLSQAARQVAEGIVAPEVDLAAVRARARAGQRRTATLAAGAVLAVVAVGAALVNDWPSSAPEPVVPVPTPTTTPTPADLEPGWSPDTTTAEEIVTAKKAKPTTLLVAAGDPDRRLGIWTWSKYAGIAVTSDGYRTTTYASIPAAHGGAFKSLSVSDDLFLVTDVANAEWLVGVDGTVRSVTREAGAVLPKDDGLWFQCGNEKWRETWCALDPDAAKAYVWPDAWVGSAVPPGRGAQPWGANPEPRAVGNTGVLEAWWRTGKDLRVRTLATAEYGDYVLGCPTGLMALWSVQSDGSRVDIHTSLDQGATWQVTSYSASSANQWWKVRCAPDGSFLAVDSERGVVVWRAEAEGGTFRQVYAAPGAPDSIGRADLWADDGHVYASGEGVLAISEDSGKTWTDVRKWR